MIFEPLPLDGSFRIRITPQTDERGFFARRFCRNAFAAQGLELDFVQRSVSFNRDRGTLRGLHFQAEPMLETKIVRCIRGSAYDVMVDLRFGSPSFGRWHGEILSAENRVAVYIPRGFAHGFQTIEDATEIDYEITPAYVAEAARGVAWNDPDLGIAWPMPDAAIVSPRDRSYPPFRELSPLNCSVG